MMHCHIEWKTVGERILRGVYTAKDNAYSVCTTLYGNYYNVVYYHESEQILCEIASGRFDGGSRLFHAFIACYHYPIFMRPFDILKVKQYDTRA